MMNHSSDCSWHSSDPEIAYSEIVDRYSSSCTGTQTKIRRAILMLLSAIVTLVVTDVKPVQAQAIVNHFGNFGIPTPSQRFLGEGRVQFEREIRNLQTPPDSQPLLTIDPDVYIQDDLLRLEDPRFHSGNLPPEAIDLPVVPPASPMTGPRSHL